MEDVMKQKNVEVFRKLQEVTSNPAFYLTKIVGVERELYVDNYVEIGDF